MSIISDTAPLRLSAAAAAAPETQVFLKRVPITLKASAAGVVEGLTSRQLDEIFKQNDIHSPDSMVIRMDLRRLGILR